MGHEITHGGYSIYMGVIFVDYWGLELRSRCMYVCMDCSTKRRTYVHCWLVYIIFLDHKTGPVRGALI